MAPMTMTKMKNAAPLVPFFLSLRLAPPPVFGGPSMVDAAAALRPEPVPRPGETAVKFLSEKFNGGGAAVVPNLIPASKHLRPGAASKLNGGGVTISYDDHGWTDTGVDAAVANDEARQKQEEDGEEKPEKRIVGGSIASRADYPFFASFRGCGAYGCCGHSSSDYCWGGCGAVLISKRHLLTAGHCVIPAVRDKFELKGVRVGAYCRKGRCNGAAAFVNATWADVSIHYGYTTTGMPENDAAIITLQKDFTTTDPVYVDTGSILKDLGDLADLHTIGHGKTVGSEVSSASDKLLEARMFSLPDSACESRYTYDYFESNMMCAGQHSDFQSETSTCNGDSGGPLLSMTGAPGNKPCLVGITSWGPNSCAGGTAEPSVFARVSEMVKWFGPEVCNTFTYKDDRPRWCGVCDNYNSDPNAPGWCATVTAAAVKATTATTAAPLATTDAAMTTTDPNSGSTTQSPPAATGTNSTSSSPSASATIGTTSNSTNATTSQGSATSTTNSTTTDAPMSNNVTEAPPMSSNDTAPQVITTTTTTTLSQSQLCHLERPKKHCDYGTYNKDFCSCGFLADLSSVDTRKYKCGFKNVEETCFFTCQELCGRGA